jgi:RNA polymerase sigma factor (sigma-70 family)
MVKSRIRPTLDSAMASLPNSLQSLLDPLAQASDRQLLENFTTTGNQSAFAALLERHGPMLLGLCRRQVRDPGLADDVIQATFLVLARKANSIRRRDSIAGWLWGVARRLARQAQLSEAARSRRERNLAKQDRQGPGDPAWDELLRVLDDELQQLGQRYRTPLLLCYLEGRTQDEAAQQLGWSLRTLRRRLERGRELLRARMIRRGATLGAGLLASLVAPSSVRAALTTDLRQAVVHSAVSPAANVAPAVLLLARGETRMTLLTKIMLAACLILTLAGGTAVYSWYTASTAPASLAPSSPWPPQRDRLDDEAAAQQLRDPAPGRDVFDDGLPKGAVARLGTVRFRHGAWGRGLAFPPDGRFLVSMGGGWVNRWDLATGQARFTFGKGWTTGIIDTDELVTSDGKLAVICRFSDAPVGAEWTCTEYELDTGKERRSVALELPQFVNRRGTPHLASPDGKFWAGVASDVMVWHAATGKLAHHLKAAKGHYTAAAFTPDSNTLLIGDDAHTIHAIDLATGKEQRSFGLANVDGVGFIAVSPDGKRVATIGGADDFVRLWNLERGTEERTLDFPEGRVSSLLFTTDRRTVVIGVDGNRLPFEHAVRTWDVATGKPGRAWTDDPNMGLNVAVSPDGKLLATMNDAGVIRLWDMETGKERQPLAASPCGFTGIGLQPDGKTYLTIGTDQRVRSWDAATGRLRDSLARVDGQQPRFVEGGLLLVLAGRDQLELVDPATGKVLLKMAGNRAVVSADGKRLATSGSDGAVHVYEIGKDEPIANWIMSPEGDIKKPAYPVVRGLSADGAMLVLQGDVVSTWNVATAKQRTSWSLERNDVVEKDQKAKGFGNSRPIQAVAVSPDGTKIAFGIIASRPRGPGGGKALRIGKLMILETATAKLLDQSELEDSDNMFTRMLFSPDGKLLAAAGNGPIRVWHVGTAKPVWQFEGHRGPVTALSFSSDSRRLASASSDSTALVWELTR